MERSRSICSRSRINAASAGGHTLQQPAAYEPTPFFPPHHSSLVRLMLSPRPIEIPEILLHVAHYVPKGILLVCARVSKAWHRVFIPLIWKDIKIHRIGRNPLEAIHSHSHFVKALEFDCPFEQKHLSLNCQNLTSVHVIVFNTNALEFTIKYPSVTHS